MSFATVPTGRLILIPTTSRKVLFNGPHLTPLGTRRWSGIDLQHYRIAIGNVGSGRAGLAEVGGEVSAIDGQALGRYLENMSNVLVYSLNPAEQFVYWLNLYNALTVKAVLDHYPVTSI